jgi:hypothetical protein
MAKRGKETGSRDLPYQDKDRYATRLISGAIVTYNPLLPHKARFWPWTFSRGFRPVIQVSSLPQLVSRKIFHSKDAVRTFAHLLRPSNASIGGPLSQQPPRSNAGSEQDAPCRLVRLPYCTRDSETGLRWLHSRRPATSPSR